MPLPWAGVLRDRLLALLAQGGEALARRPSGAYERSSDTIEGMKVRILALAATGLGVIAVALAFHFEVSARSRAESELRALRADTITNLDEHRISASRAAALERRLAEARTQIEKDDVLGAQEQLLRVRADLRTATRAA